MHMEHSIDASERIRHLPGGQGIVKPLVIGHEAVFVVAGRQREADFPLAVGIELQGSMLRRPLIKGAGDRHALRTVLAATVGASTNRTHEEAPAVLLGSAAGDGAVVFAGFMPPAASLVDATSFGRKALVNNAPARLPSLGRRRESQRMLLPHRQREAFSWP